MPQFKNIPCISHSLLVGVEDLKDTKNGVQMVLLDIRGIKRLAKAVSVPELTPSLTCGTVKSESWNYLTRQDRISARFLVQQFIFYYNLQLPC